jgi:hypothetical protein
MRNLTGGPDIRHFNQFLNIGISLDDGAKSAL